MITRKNFLTKGQNNNLETKYQAFFKLNLIVFGFQDAWDPKDEEEEGEEEENGEKDMETQEDNKENTNTKEKAGHDESPDDKDRNDDDAKVSAIQVYF